MRPFLEKIPWRKDSSLAMLHRRLPEGIPFQWHHHPEFELTLTLNSKGQRFIGDHVGHYANYDLVLVGPNLPHTWISHDIIDHDQPHIAQVIWFGPDITRNLVEFDEASHLLERGLRGLHFSENIARRLASKFEAFFDQTPQDQWFTLVSILQALGSDETATPLANHPAGQTFNASSNERINRVLNHIHANYTQKISMAELSDIAALSMSGLHRMFYKHSGCSISEYIIDLRIGDACARLAGTNEPITHIAHSVGYHNQANFNRQFKSVKHMTPRQYRSGISHR